MAKKKNWFLENIFNIIALLILIAVIIFFSYGYTQGFIAFRGDKATPEQEETLEAPSSPDCSIRITPSSIDFGGSVTGIIWTKEPNTFCEIFAREKDDDVWRKIAEGTTDIDGNLASTEEIFVSGDFVFAALCRDCRTNDDDLHVNPEIFPDDSDDSDDSDITINQYCTDLGYHSYWDHEGEGNCYQAAINYCTPTASEYFYNSEKEWCCYRCVAEEDPFDGDPFDESDCVIEEVVTRGGVRDGIDEILYTPTFIYDFHQGSTYYYELNDFLIGTANIDWSPNGAEPAPGTSYTIIYNYCN